MDTDETVRLAKKMADAMPPDGSIEVMRIDQHGPWTITFTGFSELLRRAGFPPLVKEPEEGIVEWSRRVREAREAFYRDHRDLWPENCKGPSESF